MSFKSAIEKYRGFDGGGNADYHQYSPGHGFKRTGGDQPDTPWQPGWNIGHRKEAQEFLKKRVGEVQWTEGFTTPNSQDHMVEVKYDPSARCMLVVYAKTGKESNRVFFDLVPQQVYLMLKQQAERTGRCGAKLWELLRIKGTDKGTRHPYWHE